MSTLTDGLHQATRRVVRTLRRWFDPPIDGDSRPLELREAIVDAVEQKAESAGAGRRVLPFNHLTATIVADNADVRAALGAGLGDLEDAIRTRLGEIGCPVPAGFETAVQYVDQPEPAWPPGRRFVVAFDTRAVTRRPPVRDPAPPTLVMTVLRGQTLETSYSFSEALIRIGRSALPTDHRGRPRVNHVAFLEDGDTHSATVGRAHASIHYDAIKREYRLFDDGSHNGTRVIRGASTLTIAANNPVGVRILSGDELQFGTAAVRVEIDGGV
jgi:hypothetical protein